MFVLYIQEVYEMAQRKFLRQIANFNQGDDPFPRLFVVDFNYSSRAENEADKVSYVTSFL